MKPHIKVDGYAEAVVFMGQLTRAMQKVMLKKTMRAAAKPMLNTALAGTPRRTGELAKKLKTVNLKPDKRKPGVVSVGIKHVFGRYKNKGTINQYYGWYVHEGTARGIKPNRYLANAYQKHEAEYIDSFGSLMAREIEKFLNKKPKKVK